MTQLRSSLLLLAMSIAISNAVVAQATPQPAPAATPTLKASTRIVIIDVGVVDSQGKAVTNLTSADFGLKENGAAQTISHFEVHAALPSAEATKLPEMPKLPPNMFTNYSPAPSSGALNVLLLDALNTPMKDQAYVRAEMLKYLKTPHPGMRMAIFGLTTKLVLLQGFTSDPEVLRAAVANAKNGPKASAMMDNAISGDQPGADNMMDNITNELGGDESATLAAAALQQFDAEIKSYQLQMRIQYTLDAMNDLARYLSALPGRKNLIWFSGSFPINIMPDGSLSNPFSVAADYADEFRKTATMMARAQVAVYPIDARGLMTSPMFDASSSGTNMVQANPKAMMKDQQTFTDSQASEHNTMQQMADDTGGKAFVNTNDLTTAVEKAVGAGANYYSLTYTPTNHDWKGDFRKVQVQLAKSGYTLSYRHGYFADDDTPKHKDEAEEPSPMMGGGRRGGGGGMGAGGMGAPAANPLDPKRAAIRAAMQFGGPQPTEILLKIAVNPSTGTPEKEVAKGNFADPKISGPFERYTIFVVALPSDFTFTSAPDGKHRLALEFITNVYNSNGEVLNVARVRTTRDLDDAQYNAVVKAGLQFRQEISVPLKGGQHFLRIGLHDLAADRVGAIELPVSAVAKLKPLAPAAPAAPPPASAPPPPPPQ